MVNTEEVEGPSVLRLVAMLVAGIASGIALGATTAWQYGVTAGWSAGAAVYIVWVMVVTSRCDAKQTQSHATREDPGRKTSDIIILSAALVSLATVAILLTAAGGEGGLNKQVVAGASLLSVALSWLLVHTVYMLRYAHLYYTEPVGGINFNTPDENPRYSDFAYVSFNLGMTYQISDTELRTSELRRVMFWHTLLSYVFGTVILAAAISLVTALIS